MGHLSFVNRGVGLILVAWFTCRFGIILNTGYAILCFALKRDKWKYRGTWEFTRISKTCSPLRCSLRRKQSVGDKLETLNKTDRNTDQGIVKMYVIVSGISFVTKSRYYLTAWTTQNHLRHFVWCLRSMNVSSLGFYNLIKISFSFLKSKYYYESTFTHTNKNFW